MLFFHKYMQFVVLTYRSNDMYLKYYSSIVYGCSSYDDVINDITVTAILFCSLYILLLPLSSKLTKLPLI